jgi:hypothetical protein
MTLPWTFIAALCILITLGLEPARAALCNGPDKVLVKVGTHLFAVPWKKASLSLEKDGESIRHPCYHDGDPPVEVPYVGFIPVNVFSPKYLNRDVYTQTHMALVIQVSIIYSDNNTTIGDLFETMNSEMQKAGVDLSSLPREGDFYVWNSLHWSSYYIAAKKDWVTPSGHPVTFKYLGGDQYAVRVYWKDNIAFGFRALEMTRHVPVTQLEEFYRDFLNYMESLEVQPDSSTH